MFVSFCHLPHLCLLLCACITFVFILTSPPLLIHFKCITMGMDPPSGGVALIPIYTPLVAHTHHPDNILSLLLPLWLAV